MKSHELRLNNLFQDQNGNLLRVSELNENIMFSVVDRSRFPLPDGWQAEPIKLTIDLFEKYDSVFKTKELLYMKLSNCELWYIDNVIYVASEDCPNTDYAVKTNIKYVHQLQNLFLDLEEKELEYNETELCKDGKHNIIRYSNGEAYCTNCDYTH